MITIGLHKYGESTNKNSNKFGICFDIDQAEAWNLITVQKTTCYMYDIIHYFVDISSLK